MQFIFEETRDKPQPRFFLPKREEPGNEVGYILCLNGSELACLGEMLKNKNLFTYIILFIAVIKTSDLFWHLKSLM